MSDDALKRLNILILSGVLSPVSVAAALRMTEIEWARMTTRAVPLTEGQSSALQQLLDDYTAAMNDVGMRWRNEERFPR
jgi:hypothetical protein